jgi:hypothetical protein
MYIAKGDKIYTFYDHAAGRMRRRKIRFEWVEDVVLNPDVTMELEPPRIAYQKVINKRSLTVVVDEAENLIVTVYEGEESD